MNSRTHCIMTRISAETSLTLLVLVQFLQLLTDEILQIFLFSQGFFNVAYASET